MKEKLKLKLRKQVISNLQSKKIVGGNDDSTSWLFALFTCTHPDRCRAQPSWDVECFNSLGSQDMSNAGVSGCDQIGQ